MCLSNIKVICQSMPEIHYFRFLKTKGNSKFKSRLRDSPLNPFDVICISLVRSPIAQCVHKMAS